MRQRWREGGSQSFTHVDKRVEQDQNLQPAYLLQQCPGVIHTAQKGDWDYDDAEDQSDLLRLHGDADCQADRTRN